MISTSQYASDPRNKGLRLIFLGTGGAWGMPEISCPCMICREMRRRREHRGRAAILLEGRSPLLLDCGPDIRSQLLKNPCDPIQGVLISHAHGDHYLGLDDLLAFSRSAPRQAAFPIPVYLTAPSWELIAPRFGYLQEMGAVEIRLITPGCAFQHLEFHVLPFATAHGSKAPGSVGFVVRFSSRPGEQLSLLYTSDLTNIPELLPELLHPDYLIIQTFWFNEPIRNRPGHLSFQRALDLVQAIAPRRETFLVHLGDGDQVPGDPANDIAKKTPPLNALRPPGSQEPYPVPCHHLQWQQTVERVIADRGLPYRITVAYDGLALTLQGRS